MQKKPTTQLGRSCIQAVDRHMNTLRRHKQHRTKNSLRDVILGGQDGLVNMLGIALGVVAAGGSNHVLVVTGIAAAITESISMGAVAYTSFGSDRDFYLAEKKREQDHVSSRPEEERLQALRTAFFAPGHDARVWLTGWHREVDEAQFEAGRATPQSEWWSGGNVRLLDLQAELDPFKPRSMMNETRDEFGERADIVVIPDASHALIPEQPTAVVAAIVTWIGKLPKP